MEELVVHVEVVLELGELSEIIAKSLAPDNVNVPEDLEFEMKHSNGRVEIRLASPISKIDTLLSTIDEILEHASLVERTLGEIRRGD